MNNPKIFIASSVEGLDIAYSIQTNLNYDADCTVWSQGVFALSTPPIDSLSKLLDNSDFAIFVFSPDDEITTRRDAAKTVRDNVLFELGLFVGRLGKNRCFIVAPDKPQIRFASDLVGVTPAMYSGERDISEMTANLGPACQQIRREIRTLGRFRPEAATGHIPATETGNYDASDKKILLHEWLNNASETTAYKYDEVDDELKLDRGTVKRLIKEVINEVGFYRIAKEGANFFMLDRYYG